MKQADHPAAVAAGARSGHEHAGVGGGFHAQRMSARLRRQLDLLDRREPDRRVRVLVEPESGPAPAPPDA